jgi:anti-sigma regulatory factor (Ser/Thr protein kinase)
MEVSTHQRLIVSDRSHVAAVRSQVRAAAQAAHLSEPQVHDAGIIATELATNLVKHTPTGGEILVRAEGAEPDAGVEMIALDRGPGIADVGRAMTDGHSSAGSAGTGLGAARRLSAVFDIYSKHGAGTVVLSQIGFRAPASSFAVGSVSVSRPGELICGDALGVQEGPERLLVVIADGLGHGPAAREAAESAVRAATRNSSGDCAAILERMHAASRPTRGSAGAVAWLSRQARSLKFAGVGNIAGVVVSSDASRHTVSANGTLGHLAKFREFAYPWTPDSLLVLHSDGLSTHWSLDSYAGLRARHPAVVAAVLYRDFARQRDDVTVFVAREAA